MEIYNNEVFLNYKEELETAHKEMKLLINLGDVNTNINKINNGKLIASKLFAFIDSKYSSKIEGIYTGLFDIVNTGIPNKQENIIKPIVEALLYKEKEVSLELINNIADRINVSNDTSKRWKPEFGVYEGKGPEAKRIYKPSLDKEEVEKELKIVLKEASKETSATRSILNHIWFEKIHPFYDGNGRIGRLILNKSISRLFKNSDVFPISWAIFKNKQKYYDSFDVTNNKELNAAIRSMLDVFNNMTITINEFLDDINIYLEKNKKEIMDSSTRMTEDIAENILFNLQTKASTMVKDYGLNSRTVNSIFERITMLDFNEQTIGREKLWWNIELESIIDKHFGG